MVSSPTACLVNDGWDFMCDLAVTGRVWEGGIISGRWVVTSEAYGFLAYGMGCLCERDLNES